MSAAVMQYTLHLVACRVQVFYWAIYIRNSSNAEDSALQTWPTFRKAVRKCYLPCSAACGGTLAVSKSFCY